MRAAQPQRELDPAIFSGEIPITCADAHCSTRGKSGRTQDLQM
jgi:hypothetical protein